MKLNVEINLDNFFEDGEWNDIGDSAGNVLIGKIAGNLVNRLEHDTLLTNRVANILLSNKEFNATERFENEILEKIKRSKISKKVESLVEYITEEEIKRVIFEKFDIEKMIKDEVANQTLKLLTK